MAAPQTEVTQGCTSGAWPPSVCRSRTTWGSLVPPTPTFYSRGSHRLWRKGKEPRALASWRRARMGRTGAQHGGPWESGFTAPCSKASPSPVPRWPEGFPELNPFSHCQHCLQALEV